MTHTPSIAKADVRKLPLHQRIVWARKRKGISQERLAETIGTSRRHMIRIEKGTRPGPVFRARIAEATDQPVEFFDDEDDEESDPAMREAFHLFVDLLGQINAKAVNPKPAALPSDGSRDGLQTTGG